MQGMMRDTHPVKNSRGLNFPFTQTPGIHRELIKNLHASIYRNPYESFASGVAFRGNSASACDCVSMAKARDAARLPLNMGLACSTR